MLRSIYLVRHGESVSNAGGITMPHALIPLTEAGCKQADALSEGRQGFVRNTAESALSF
ncbi:phosphoglycerate mutase family protein [Pseudoxanthomonas japonensis]|uniref:phosphoglycerate mutase family protein n=1 Tax=Pseudoxanthomonas japonensis TaxID=69284 RepID=UPI00286D4435|nr:phosphoglycerate mutase family protein [Pseudoxanthomonas japonensis]